MQALLDAPPAPAPGPVTAPALPDGLAPNGDLTRVLPPGWRPPPAHAPATAMGVAVGAPVALETPGGVLSGRVTSAEFESRWDFGFDPCGPDDFRLPLSTRTTDDHGWATRCRPLGPPSQKLDLRIRLDANPLAAADDETAGAVARRAAAAYERLTQQREERMALALMGTGGTLYADGAAGTYPAGWVAANEPAVGWTTNCTTTTQNWGVADIQAAMVQWRAMAAASSDTAAVRGARVWYSSGEAAANTALYTVDANTWDYRPTAGGWEVRVTATYGGDWGRYEQFTQPFKKPEERLREMIRSRMAPSVLRHRDPHENPARPGLKPTDDFRELRARETLAKVIGEEKFRRFVRDGFVTCRAKSGRTYQIFPGSNFTRVFAAGKEQPRLCVVLNGKFPPTDSLIVRYLMVLNDEEGFRKLAVNQGIAEKRLPAARDERPLSEIFDRYKRDYARFERRKAAAQPSAEFDRAAERELTPVAAAG